MHNIFIYGTLKRGFPNHHFIENFVRFVGQFRTRTAYPLVVGGTWYSPYLINEPGQGHRVKGEIFTTDDAGLQVVDQLEGTDHPNGYRRVMVMLEGDIAAKNLDAWTYVKARKDIDGIHSGPMRAYNIDLRYVIPSQRPKVF